ncbi:thioester-containing protein [Nesidiocoris tenuis]|uniref:Thioester-containing protein n=1 Tax=Nesidiocoris tenuis TaxID=355587 RepID=A0ABN7A8I2_9HEMI|nr:thioester-containing protein [Nesidiocoris tenuis]
MIPTTKAETYQIGRPVPKPGTPGYKPDIGPRVPYKKGNRPPLAGPFAFSRLPKQVIHRPRVYFSDSNIPINTWLFANFTIGYQGKHTLSKIVPDSITSWFITGFSLDPVYGLGLSQNPSKVKVFRPFFVSLDLPYSVLRGESLTIPVVVFNYQNKAVEAVVTLDNAGQFEFADFSNDVNDQPKLELFRRKTITVPANSGATTSFMITPKELGYTSISVKARTQNAADAVSRKLLVKPEGETIYRNKAVFIDLRAKDSFSTNVTIDIPVNIVPQSEFVEVSVVGNLLGASLQNLEKLIQMPFGCGEQNMLNFVPNIVILDYLTNSNQLAKAIETKTKRYLNLGFQQELTYKHKNNSYSAFGNADPSGSTWLTAFVAKSFKQARRYIDIDDAEIIGPLEWLADNQAPNGRFPEVGTVSHKEMQGGASQGLALTAYVITTFIETQSVTNRFRNTINKGMDYIHRQIKAGDVDTYSVAVAAYALHSANHPSKDAAFELLETRAKTKGDLKWWTRDDSDADSKNPNAQLPNSIDVEITAYAMLTYLEKGLVADAIPVMKWLISQQNEQGGFASTQDTVVALGALARLAEAIIYSDIDVTAKFEYLPGESFDIQVNPNSAMILQKSPLPQRVRHLNITATGRGFAVLQVSYRYNVNVTGPWPLFNLDPQVDKNSNKNHLQLSICSSYTGGNDSSNMAVMEVTLPSGYTADLDKLPSLEYSQSVKRVETKNGDTVVVLYFDQMTDQELCPTVSAFRTHKVAKQRPVPVTLYDYYDQSRKARVFYEPLVANLCDICENEDCKICDGSSRGSGSIPGSNSQTGEGSAIAYGPSFTVIIVTLLFATFRL